MKLKVENLAKIKEAEVDVKNLTLFIGQNSTNKSYMAHVIYEIYKYSQTILDLPLSKIDIFTGKIYNSLLENKKLSLYHIEGLSNFTQEQDLGVLGNEIKLTYEPTDTKFRNIIESIYNEIIINITQNINQSFNANKILIEKVFFSQNTIQEIMDKKQISLYPYMQTSFENKSVIDRLILEVFFEFSNSFKEERVHYFPASRSSYMLTLEPMYAGIFGGAMRGKTNISKLTEPTIDFIENFYEIKTNESKIEIDSLINKLINFLETQIVKGKLIEETNELGHKIYYLETNNKKIDLQLTSSMTLEVLPFIVFLKNIQNIKKSFFAIEEPEAHLHPKAQIQMARFIVMLVNSGAKVLVTTHSDYLLGEINNCIKKYELQEDEISISQDDVSAYLFKNMENETVVKELDIDKFGVSDENFEEALDELLEESGNLTDRILENE